LLFILDIFIKFFDIFSVLIFSLSTGLLNYVYKSLFLFDNLLQFKLSLFQFDFKVFNLYLVINSILIEIILLIIKLILNFI